MRNNFQYFTSCAKRYTHAMEVQMPQDLSQLSQHKLQEWLNSFDVVICDCDGVLWSYMSLIHGSNDAINKFFELKKKVFLFTNFSATTREEMVLKCLKMGINVDIDNILTSSFIVAQHLKNSGFDKKLFVVGHAALGKELDSVGIAHTGIGEDHLSCDLPVFYYKHFKLEENIGAVVVGFDEHFSYKKLIKAVNYLQDPSVLFYATSTDPNFKFPAFLHPETGPIVSAVEVGSQRKATVLGKPSTAVLQIIKDQLPDDPRKVLVIGDSLNTDVVFGNSAGFQTLFVESGQSSLKDIEDVLAKINEGQGDNEELKKMIPEYYAKSLGDLVKNLP